MRAYNETASVQVQVNTYTAFVIVRLVIPDRDLAARFARWYVGVPGVGKKRQLWKMSLSRVYHASKFSSSYFIPSWG
jgi:hypothetical protein